MRGLTILLVEASTARLRTALTMGCAQASLSGRCRIFLDAAAVPLLRLPVAADDDAIQRRAGQPPLADLIEEALALGVAISACQTGLALAGLSADQLDPRVDYAGLTSMFAALGDDRLLAL